VRTIGGGYVLNPVPKKHKRFNQETIKGLEGIKDLEPVDLVSYYIGETDLTGASLQDLIIMTNLPAKKLDSHLQALLSQKKIILLDKENKIYIHGDRFNMLIKTLLDNLQNYHEANPLKAGMPKEELKNRILYNRNPKLFTLIVNHAAKSNEVVVEEDMIRLESHTVSLQADQADIKKKIIETYEKSGLQPSYFRVLNKELDLDDCQAKEVLMLLVEEGTIIKVKEDLFFHSNAVDGLKQRLIEFLTKEGKISTPQFKEMTGTSRKYTIPLIEYFDSTKVTLRVGDIRKLRKGQ
jgi:selenocysteine-specific elongation factor